MMVHCLPRRSAAQTGAEPILRAMPTGNTGNTKNTGVSTRKRVGHVPWNFRSTWLTVCYRQSIACRGVAQRRRAQSRYCGQGNTDLYGLIRTGTDYGHMVQCGPCAVEFPGRMAVREPKPCPYSSVFVCISLYYTAPPCVLCKVPCRQKKSRIRFCPDAGFWEMRNRLPVFRQHIAVGLDEIVAHGNDVINAQF